MTYATGNVDFDSWIQQRLREAAAAKLLVASAAAPQQPVHAVMQQQRALTPLSQNVQRAPPPAPEQLGFSFKPW
jgi:hypothetical protein